MINEMNNHLNKISNLNETQLKQFNDYYEILIEESKKYNLTTLTNIDDVYIKHFYDSLLLLNTNLFSNTDLSILDIGSGAGFPGIPLKIACPNIHVTLLEPTLKRCNFLRLVIEKLGLQNIEVVNDRAEEYFRKTPNKSFDFVTARAVAPLNILLELSIPFVKVNGYFLGMKGSSASDEINSSLVALNKLNSKVVNTYNFNLPMDKGERIILVIQKEKETNDIYPRMYAKIKKQPL